MSVLAALPADWLPDPPGELIVCFFNRVGSRRSRRIRRSSKPCRSLKRPRRTSTSGPPRTPLPSAPRHLRKRILPRPSRHLPPTQPRSARRRASLPCPVPAAGVATPRPTTTPTPLSRPRTRPSRRQRARSTTRRSRPTRRETRRSRPLPLRPTRPHHPIRPAYSPPPPRPPLRVVGRPSS